MDLVRVLKRGQGTSWWTQKQSSNSLSAVGYPIPLIRGWVSSMTDVVDLVGKHYSRAYRCRPGLDSYARNPMRLHNENWKTAPIDPKDPPDRYNDRLELLMGDNKARLDDRQIRHSALNTLTPNFSESSETLSFSLSDRSESQRLIMLDPAFDPHLVASMANDKIEGQLLAIGASKELLGDILYISYL